jgi:hypothetical protein
MSQQLSLSVNPEKQQRATMPKVNNSNQQYSVDYIKNHWSKDWYLFDLRWYENNAEREEVLEKVKNNYIENAGHSGFLLPIMKSHGWSDDEIADYLMSLREKHLTTLRNHTMDEVERINLQFWGVERVITCYRDFKKYCIALKQNPKPLREVLEKIKDRHREELKKEKMKLNERIIRITNKVRELERRCDEDKNL